MNTEPFAGHRRRELEKHRDAIDAALTRNRADLNGLKICVAQSYDEARDELDRLTNERARLMTEWNAVLHELSAVIPIAEFVPKFGKGFLERKLGPAKIGSGHGEPYGADILVGLSPNTVVPATQKYLV